MNFPETATWCLLRPIDTPVVDSHNEFTGSREPTIPDDSYVQVPVKHDFSEIFEREKIDGEMFGKGEWHNLVNFLCKLQSYIVFYFPLYCLLFYTYGKAMDQPRVGVSPNSVFIQEKILKSISHPV